MRNLNLQIDPFHKKRSKFKELFHGILFPPKEFFRLLRVIIYVSFSFYLITTGLDLISERDVNLFFLSQTERISLNILFFGVQTPMMMASRASISNTFSEYLQNLDWAESTLYEGQGLSEQYRRILSSTEISYDSINSNGKHLWLTVLLMIILQAFQSQILALEILNNNWGIIIKNAFGSILQFIESLISLLS